MVRANTQWCQSFTLLYLPQNFEQHKMPQKRGDNHEPHEQQPIERGALSVERLLKPIQDIGKEPATVRSAHKLFGCPFRVRQNGAESTLRLPSPRFTASLDAGGDLRRERARHAEGLNEGEVFHRNQLVRVIGGGVRVQNQLHVAVLRGADRLLTAAEVVHTGRQVGL